MNWIDKLEKRLGGFAMPNLALFLIVGQILVYGAAVFGVFSPEVFYLNPVLVARGEVWRLVTFIFIPPLALHPIFLIIAWYIFWMMSQALEAQWGTFRYNLFIWLGIFFTLLVSLVIPNYWYSNYYILLTVFFAFATLYPEFEFRIYFILPVKVKWLALISLVLLVLEFIRNPWPMRLVILASMANYLLFFGREFFSMMHHRQRRVKHKKEVQEAAEAVFHTCSICGVTDRSHPDREFRYRDGKGVCAVCLEKETDSAEPGSQEP